MNPYRQPLALLLAAAFLTAECAYADLFGREKSIVVKGVAAPSKQMNVSQARKALAESLRHQVCIKSVREVKFSRHRVTFIGDFELLKGSYLFDGMAHNCFVSFDAIIDPLNQIVETPKRDGVRVNNINGIHVSDRSQKDAAAQFETDADAQMFIVAHKILEKAALAPDTEGADFAAFTSEAKIWLVTTPKPEMSDEARTYKVLAEDAFERKDFTAALDAYCKALNKYPMWPKGQYNAAVLAAEAEDYDLAARHMRRYLVLSPEAKDAQAAKDKLLLWQLKAKE
ncbi:MAG: hypothetical protein D4R57_01735 [Verrucomicrobiales bacterium]|nr:MAG: hypothetical protein D4R57_01735 [Verrucomicrobiales bacterium]